MSTMTLSSLLTLLLVLLGGNNDKNHNKKWANAAIRIEFQMDDTGDNSYSVIDYDKNVPLFQGSDIAVFIDGEWCVAGTTTSTANVPNHNKLIPSFHKSIQGNQNGLGSYHGFEVGWNCTLSTSFPDDENEDDDDDDDNETTVPIITTFKNFDCGSAVLFELEWPNGATNTQIVDNPNEAMTNFPSFVRDDTSSVALPSVLSWQGSFMHALHDYSIGSVGGPTVFYNSFDNKLSNVIVGSPFSSTTTDDDNDVGRHTHWKTFTAGNNQDWSRLKKQVVWSPGTSGRITELPNGFKQSIILYQGSNGGITSTMEEWGTIMQANGSKDKKKKQVQTDVTLTKVGYQTDNGAWYCFCQDKNCSQTMIDEMSSLKEEGTPMGYLSFQGAGTSSGRGHAAPWCIETWGVDPGGLNGDKYPLSIKDMQQAIDIPLQLYAPYFCPSSTYFQPEDEKNWTSIQSNTTLPGCDAFDFQSVVANQSYDFYSWFYNKGITHGSMTSFESDFMNQNYNCMPEFINSATTYSRYLLGMASAAYDKNITIQWCYATPTDVFAALDLPAVTNMRVSTDYCYGNSWKIGESSLLVWALGVAPSKDTLWTSSNNHTPSPGCQWQPDHEELAAELHVVLALMSTGPVGISDKIGMTNTQLLKRTITQDGTLLKPLKAITAVDSTFVDTSSGGRQDISKKETDGGEEGCLYGTYSLGPSYIFVSFKMKENYGVTLNDFYPPIVRHDQKTAHKKKEPPILLAYRQFDEGIGCHQSHGMDAISSGCIQIKAVVSDGVDGYTREATSSELQEKEIFSVPQSDTSLPGSEFSPTITYVWKTLNCTTGNPSAGGDFGWFFLGELDKYVSLSPDRFVDISCCSSSSCGAGEGEDGSEGVFSAALVGSVGEIVKLTALEPRVRNNHLLDDGAGARYRVVYKEVEIPKNKVAKVIFGATGGERSTSMAGGIAKISTGSAAINEVKTTAMK